MMTESGDRATISLLLWGYPPLRGGVGFGTHTGTQDSRVPEKVPCRFLLSEGRRWKGAHRGSTKLVRQAGPWEARGCLCPGHSAQPGSWILLFLWVPRWCPRTQGWESIPGPSLPPHLLPGQVMEGGVQAKVTGRHVGSRAARGPLGQPRPRSLVLRGPHEPNPPAAELGVTSQPSGPQEVGAAQKMLCRRLFPRPGC